MVEALCPARFYGGSLPRPRFLSDDARVDPLPPVMDPLLAWAADAHWSMGGLSFVRKRLVGKIDGRVERIRAHKEQVEKKAAKVRKYALVDESEEDGDASPPPVRVTRKREARGGEDGVAEMESSGESGRGAKRRLVKKADVGGGLVKALVEASTRPSPRRSPRTKKIEGSYDGVEEIRGKKSPRSSKLTRKIKN